MKYQEFMKTRLSELVDEGMASKDAMKQIGKEWRAYKAGSTPTQTPPVSTQPAQSKLKGTRHTLRLELPYQIEAQPDLAAAWDVAEGIIDYLMENASGISAAQSFRQRAAAAYVRAKGGTSEGDQNEYELGRNLAEALLLVMAHRGFTQDEWVQMLPPQLIDDTAITSGEDKGLIDKGLELLGLDDENSASSKVAKQLKDKAIEAGGQTVLDMLTQ